MAVSVLVASCGRLGMTAFDGKVTSAIEKYVDGSLKDEGYHSYGLLSVFYERSGFSPVWYREGGNYNDALALVDIIEKSSEEGLSTGYYHLDEIMSYLKKFSADQGHADPGEHARLDLLLTDAFITIGCHLSEGCLNPKTLEARQGFDVESDGNVINALEDAVRNHTVKKAMDKFVVHDDEYYRLKDALQHYMHIAASGGWPQVPDGKGSLKLGMRDDRVPVLRKRLEVEGDYVRDADSKEGKLYDRNLWEAVIRFQVRHGLGPDGVVGRSTLSALNETAEHKVRRMEVNLERMRWSRHKLGTRYVAVNIADFSLKVVDNDSEVMSMNVVTGKQYWNTPLLSSSIRTVVLNPSWSVPDSIFAEEVLPKAKKDPQYIASRGYEVLKGWGDKPKVIDPSTVNWKSISPTSPGIRLKQEPGPHNPLGKVKFIFPNAESVYLHDTPNKRLFGRVRRDFSHGCIRIERPLDLTEYLLKDTPGWDMKKALSVIDKGKETFVKLGKPINIYIQYLTAWVDKDGTVNFRQDVYGRDKRVDKALEPLI